MGSVNLDNYDMSDSDDLNLIYNNFDRTEEQDEIAFGNTGILIDTLFVDSSLKSRNLFCVFILLNVTESRFLEPLTSDIYKNIFDGYTDDTQQFINNIKRILELKNYYVDVNDDVLILLEWALKRTRERIELIYA